jgi:hypothetical protein
MTDPGVIKAGGGITAYAVRDGTRLWHASHTGTVQPMIVDGVFYSPDAHDLHTGQSVTWPGTDKRRSLRAGTGCATYAGCPTLAMSRFSSLGFKDLNGHLASFTYSPVRASCWINMIPAGGLVVVPEGSSSCQCAYNYKMSLSLMSDDRLFDYGLGGTDRAGAPALRINFGAPGDRADEEGQIWYAYPRPVAYGRCLGNQPYGPKPAGPHVPVEQQGADSSVQTWGRNPDWVKITGGDRPWVSACGLEGRLHLTIRPPRELQAADRWRVVLHFCELSEPSAARICDLMLQGETVLSGWDIAAAAGGTGKAISKTFVVDRCETLLLELLRRNPNAPLPTICGLEIVAQ